MSKQITDEKRYPIQVMVRQGYTKTNRDKGLLQRGHRIHRDKFQNNICFQR